jgi:hypothetical protein
MFVLRDFYARGRGVDCAIQNGSMPSTPPTRSGSPYRVPPTVLKMLGAKMSAAEMNNITTGMLIGVCGVGSG